MQQDDEEGVRTLDDDNFIDDTGVDPADRYDNDNGGHSPRRFAQVFILNCSYAIGNSIYFKVFGQIMPRVNTMVSLAES
jgi:hypothetical protein